MTTPPPPDSVADVPVNIARPNWQCPHCLTKYYEDHAAATECAQAGPPAPVDPGTPVLALTGYSTRSYLPVFGLTDVGPVVAVTVDGTRRHRRDVVVGDLTVSSDQLAAAGRSGDVVVLTDARSRPTRADLRSPSLSTISSDLATLVLGKAKYYGTRYDDSVTKAWIEEPYQGAGHDSRWLRAPQETERAALNVVTGGLLDRIVEADVDTLAEKIRSQYRPGYAHRYTPGQRSESLAGPHGGLLAAGAHGAPNHIWALRWINAHLEPLVQWQAHTLRAWAAGEETLLACATSVAVGASLPKSPGKRRLAVMEPYGDTYQVVRDRVIEALTVDDPVNPVPGIGTVEDTIRATREGN